MDKIERLIKKYLGEDLDKAGKTVDCLSEQVLIHYFRRKLDSEDCQKAENHLAGCEFCRSQLDLIFEAGRAYKRGEGGKVPAELIQSAKNLLETDKNNHHKRTMRKKRITKNLFLAGAIISFVASFFVPKYFFQFLVVTLILGMRWAFESEGGHTLVMILDSWRRHSHDHDDEISNRLNDKFKSFRP
ncbi:MAG: hypothetical protein HQ570_02010 [Candidatus Omnitrophica bacterium]|nr:hypothetical protein [Candidatus Omnitrophota bacterium]